MRPTELKTLLTKAFEAKLPVLITGAPGVGKSDIVDQARQAMGADLILSHPAVADPTDAKGLPWVVGGRAEFLPFSDLRRAIEATSPTVWFIDDLGQAPASVQASYMQLFLARQVNDHKISDHVTFVAATNRRTDRAGVTGVLEPVKSRFVTIVELEPNLDDSVDYAISNNWPTMIIAFWRFQPDLLCKFTASADLTNSPVPRTWSHVVKILDLKLPPSVEQAAIAGAIGEGAGVEFSAFQRLFNELPSIDKILKDPDSVPLPTLPATLYAVATALAAKSTKDNFASVARFVERLMEAGKGEFGALCVKDAVRRNKGLSSTKAFIKMATGEMHDLVSGK